MITDAKPAALAAAGQVRWLAFGAPLPNLGFVNATRSAGEGKDRCFLEAANFSTNY